jgi:hypothetical protein
MPLRCDPVGAITKSGTVPLPDGTFPVDHEIVSRYTANAVLKQAGWHPEAILKRLSSKTERPDEVSHLALKVTRQTADD